MANQTEFVDHVHSKDTNVTSLTMAQCRHLIQMLSSQLGSFTANLVTELAHNGPSVSNFSGTNPIIPSFTLIIDTLSTHLVCCSPNMLDSSMPITSAKVTLPNGFQCL